MRGLKFSIPYVYVFSFWIFIRRLSLYLRPHTHSLDDWTFPMSLYDVPAHFLDLYIPHTTVLVS